MKIFKKERKLVIKNFGEVSSEYIRSLFFNFVIDFYTEIYYRIEKGSFLCYA